MVNLCLMNYSLSPSIAMFQFLALAFVLLHFGAGGDIQFKGFHLFALIEHISSILHVVKFETVKPQKIICFFPPTITPTCFASMFQKEP